jgi:hypothetical protein
MVISIKSDLIYDPKFATFIKLHILQALKSLRLDGMVADITNIPDTIFI